MIQDPGAGPSESPEPQPASKYERVAYDIHRPPMGAVAPAPIAMQVDSECPLDMTVRRKDCDRQGDTSPGGETANSSARSSSTSTTDAPINLNMRPSVITKAPPPPIKKRISSMHSNGEIVIKNTAGDNLSPVNCDVFIEEHFRRSLGNTYASIYGPNNNNTTQQKSSGSDTRNSSTSSTSSISSSSSSSAISTSSSLNSSSGISSSNLANFSIASQLQIAPNPVVRPAPIAPLEVTPILKVKAEAALIQPQPQQLLQHTRPELKTSQKEPGTMQHVVRPDSEEEVDDHFAKALGNDTWKMIQEKKMNL
ncbi:osteocalcin 2-like [Sabethes cyaneus]|uniref:osteocalcin 2-like n=1 Tax=Sabethes cyaneus TaxID=53552 RepID=UPI00237DBCCB|nr:osteocalcin 2-like [Sabethes cyaneus]